MVLMEKIKSSPCIRIPIWVITAIIPIILTLTGSLIYQVKQQQDIMNVLEFHDERIRDIRVELADKVGRQEYNELRTYLMRLEDKVDRLIEKTK